MIASQVMRLRRYDANAVIRLTPFKITFSNHIITHAMLIAFACEIITYNIKKANSNELAFLFLPAADCYYS